MDNRDSDSGVNTVLIVIILLILVGAGVWWYTTMRTPTPTDDSPNMTIDVKLPVGTDTPSTGS